MKVFLSLAFLAAIVFAEPSFYNRQQQQHQQQQQQETEGQRYFFARQQASTTAAVPYAPNGWKPDGPAFNLPEPQQRQPQVAKLNDSYGLPQEPKEQHETSNNRYIPPQAKGTSHRKQAQTPTTFNGLQYNRFEKQTQAHVHRPHEQYNTPKIKYGTPEYATTDFPDSSEFDDPTTVIGLPSSELEQLDSGREFADEIDGAGQTHHYQQPHQQERGQYFLALPDGRLQSVRYMSRQDLEAMRYFAKIRAENVEPLRGPIYAYAPLKKLEVTPGSLQVTPITAALATGVVNGLSINTVEAKPQKLVSPKVDIKSLTQLQYQHDNQDRVTPVVSNYAAYTNQYQAPTNLPEERYILAFP